MSKNKPPLCSVYIFLDSTLYSELLQEQVDYFLDILTPLLLFFRFWGLRRLNVSGNHHWYILPIFFGIKYKFGLEWSKEKILQYYQKYGKNPPSENGFFYYLKRDCKNNSLKKYRILCWKDLLAISLQNKTFYQRNRQNFTGKVGVERAKKYLQQKYKQNPD